MLLLDFLFLSDSTKKKRYQELAKLVNKRMTKAKTVLNHKN